MPCIRHVQKVFERMAFTKNDEAVSPVIGVILMVAITVILAAVIAAFVFGMAGNVSKTKVVSVTAQRAGATSIQLTNMGGQDVGSLTGNIVVTGDVSGTLGTAVGNTVSITTTVASNARVIATGTFTDGTSQVLLDTRV
jgi:flagellin-like protein